MRKLGDEMPVFLIVLGLGALLAVAGLVVFLFNRSRVEVVRLVPPVPGQPGTADSPEALVRMGRKIEAIKRYRELHGVGLKEAKDAVEAFEAGKVASLPAKSTVLREVQDDEIAAQIRAGLIIDAIKLYRVKTGVGLKEAKEAVEAMRDRMRSS